MEEDSERKGEKVNEIAENNLNFSTLQADSEFNAGRLVKKHIQKDYDSWIKQKALQTQNSKQAWTEQTQQISRQLTNLTPKLFNPSPTLAKTYRYIGNSKSKEKIHQRAESTNIK